MSSKWFHNRDNWLIPATDSACIWEVLAARESCGGGSCELIHYCTTWAEWIIQVAIMRGRAVNDRLASQSEVYQHQHHQPQLVLPLRPGSCKVWWLPSFVPFVFKKLSIAVPEWPRKKVPEKATPDSVGDTRVGSFHSQYSCGSTLAHTPSLRQFQNS